MERPIVNPIRTAGNKVIVEYGGHIYSVPQQDLSKVSLTDLSLNRWLAKQKTQQHQQFTAGASGGCYGSREETRRPVSDIRSELSDSNLSDEQGSTPKLPSMPVVSCGAAKVLSELKEEVTRLIDESIEKIEQNWAHSTKAVSEAAYEAPPELEVQVNETIKEDEALSKHLHPDGDRGQRTHREQNLQVLHTDLFETTKQQTRVKLLNEIRDLVERLKDMEMLEC